LKTTSDRVLSVLALFTRDKSDWTVEEAAAAIGVPVSTAYRYFRSLSSAELIMPYLQGRYVLGSAVIEYDYAMRLHDPLLVAAHDVVAEIADTVGQCDAMLARLYKDKVMCVHRERSRGSEFNAVGYERGRPMPIDRGAASKVILANLGARELRAIKLSERGAPLKSELRAIAAQGFSVTHGEVTPGVLGIAVPIFGNNRTLEGSLGLIVSNERKSAQKEMIATLIRAQKKIESNLALAVAAHHLQG